MENTSKPFDLVLVYRVTDYCNLNCTFCAHARELARPRQAANVADVLALGKVLSAYRQKTGHSVLVNWLGGEPLLWGPVKELGRAYKAFGLDLSATTNGTPLASKRMRRHLVDHYSQLTISVDGFASFHDNNRGKDGLFNEVQKNVIALATERTEAGRSLHLRMNVVLTSQNITQFVPLCRTFATWGVNEITYNQLGGRDRPENFEKLRLSLGQVDDLIALLPALKGEMENQGVFMNANPQYTARFKAYAAGKTICVRDCDPGKGSMFIDEQSRIAPCNFTVEDYGVHTSTITSVDQFIKLPQRFAAMQRSKHLLACRDCMSTRVSGKFEAKL